MYTPTVSSEIICLQTMPNKDKKVRTLRRRIYLHARLLTCFCYPSPGGAFKYCIHMWCYFKPWSWLVVSVNISYFSVSSYFVFSLLKLTNYFPPSATAVLRAFMALAASLNIVLNFCAATVEPVRETHVSVPMVILGIIASTMYLMYASTTAKIMEHVPPSVSNNNMLVIIFSQFLRKIWEEGW